MSRITISSEPQLSLAGSIVGSRHLGANFLFNRNAFDEGVGSGGFDEIAGVLDLGHLRYPGGTITERQFDPAQPDNTVQPFDLITGATITNTNKHALTPLSEFLGFAADIGAKVSIVLPSFRYADAILSGDTTRIAGIASEVRHFVASQLSGPLGATIEAFEIGNEWSAIGFASASDYGIVADRMAVWIADGIAAAGAETDPIIAVQASLRAARLHETEAIAAQLSSEALTAIDAVVLHNYRPYPWEQYATTAGKFDHVGIFEAAAGRPLETIVSEWNVANDSDADGLLQASGILSMFGQMMRLGMDLGHIWPVFENNTTRLAGDVEIPGIAADLMIAGEIYRQMAQSLPGLQSADVPEARDLDLDGSADVLVQTYASGTGSGAVVFLSSLTPGGLQVELEAGALAPFVSQGASAWLTRLSVADGVDSLSHTALPITHAVSVSDAFSVGWNEGLMFDLGGYETLRLEISGSDMNVIARRDGAGRDDFRTDAGTEVFVLQRDDQRDLVRQFDPLNDRLDVSNWGALGFADLSIEALVRRDGSVSWIEIGTPDHDTGALLRFSGGIALEASSLGPEHFIFAAEAPAVAQSILVTGTALRDDFRLTPDAERVVLLDDGQRDTIREFDPSADLIDLSAFKLNGLEDLELVELTRRDGTVSWIELRETNGEAVAILRTNIPGPLDIGQIGADTFLF